MGTSGWSTQQLAEFVAAVSAAENEASAATTAVERAAEALDAAVAAIVCDGRLIAAIGYPDGTAPIGELEAVKPGIEGSTLEVPGVGACSAAAAPRSSIRRGQRLVIAREATARSEPGGNGPAARDGAGGVDDDAHAARPRQRARRARGGGAARARPGGVAPGRDACRAGVRRARTSTPRLPRRSHSGWVPRSSAYSGLRRTKRQRSSVAGASRVCRSRSVPS